MQYFGFLWLNTYEQLQFQFNNYSMLIKIIMNFRLK